MPARSFAQRYLEYRRRRRRIPVIRQQTMADCGPAALAMVLHFLGKPVALADVRATAGGGQGTSAQTLIDAARSYGLSGRGVRLEATGIGELPRGAILHWESRHFVVFDCSDSASVTVVDPAVGPRTLSRESFQASFTGVALLFTKDEDDSRPQQTARSDGHRWIRELRTETGLLARVIGASLLVQVLAMAMPLITGLLIDRVVPARQYTLLGVLTASFVVLQTFSIFTGWLRASLLIRLRTSLDRRLTIGFVQHLVALPYSFFQQRTTGDLLVRLNSNSSIRDILTSTTLSVIIDGSMAGVYLVALLLTHFQLAMLVVALAVARGVLMFAVRRKQRRLLMAGLENQAKSHTSQVELLTGIEQLKSMGLEDTLARAWAAILEEGLTIAASRGRLDALSGAALSALGTAGTLVLMFYGTFLVLEQALTLGTMLAFGALAGSFLSPLNNLVASGTQLQMLKVYAERVEDVMLTEPEQRSGDVTPVSDLEGRLQLENVSFRFARSGPTIIDDVTLTVTPQSRIAIVGKTGSGKSTLARLLAGLYMPSEGRILLDGRDLRTLELKSVRKHFGIVTQDSQVFAGSIRRNIALANPTMPDEDVVRAARLACIDGDIREMAMGYDTLLVDGGVALSGGQRQRLAIARALAARPKLLILDEATSHLDQTTEAELEENLSTLDCTRITIAHRLSSVLRADRIFVVDAGRIAEEGTHATLIEAGGTYAKMFAHSVEE